MPHNVTTQWTDAHGKVLLAMSMEPREIGRRIAAFRNERGWSQVELAHQANVSPSSVARWEAGKLPSVRELVRLAGVLEVDAEELVERPLVRLPEDQSELLRQVAEGVIELLRTRHEVLDRFDRIESSLSRLAAQTPRQHQGSRT